MKPRMLKDEDGRTAQVAGWGVAQTIDGTSASVQSTVIDANDETLVRLFSETKVWVLIGTNPTALAGGTCTPVLGESYIILPANNKIAVYGGELTITSCY